MNLPVPKPSSWSGSTLSAHHFQWADACAEHRSHFYLTAFAPDAWGVLELTLTVAQDVVRAARVSIRFPSGVMAKRAVNDALERPLRRVLDGKSELDVFLGIPKAATRAPNVSTGTASFPVRYRAVADEALEPDLRLLFGDEHEGEFEKIRVGRLERKGSLLAFDPWVMPPMARLYVGSPLVPALAQLTKALHTRQTTLLDARRDGGRSRFEPDRLAQLRLLTAINVALTALSAEPQRCAPARAYAIVTRLLGELEGLAGTLQDIPALVHEDPGPAFRDVLGRLSALIPSVARDLYTAVAFERYDRSMFRAKAPNGAAFRRRLYLVASGVDKRTSVATLPLHAKVAGSGQIRAVVQHALPGILVGCDFDAPASLPDGPNDAVFRLEQRGELWADVLGHGALEIFVPNAPPELKFTVYFAEE